MAFTLGRWMIQGVRKMFGRSVFENAGLQATAISDEMAQEIDRWKDLYYNQAEWLVDNKLTLGLPSLLSRELATLVTLEAELNVACDTNELNERAKLIQDVLDNVAGELPLRVEYACAMGGLVFKPYVAGDKICIDYVNADCFYPVTFNSRGEITEAIFVEKKHTGGYDYTRVERHRLDGTKYTITNKAYKAFTSNAKNLGDAFGNEIQLSDVEDWKEIQPETKIDNMERMLFAYFRIPFGNVVNVNSNLGVSVFAKADKAGLLREADKQFQRLMWEYEGGELAIDASSDAFRLDRQGIPELPKGSERLYRLNDIDSKLSGSAALMNTFSPALRDSNYYNGLNALMQKIEDVCGIARGTISDASSVEKTATEIKTSRQRTYATVTQIQRALEKSLDELHEAVNALITLYSLAPDGDYEVSYVWDDSVIVDADTERNRDMAEVQQGLLAPWEYRAKWMGETEEQAKAVIQEMMQTSAMNSLMMQAPPIEE